MINFEEVLNKIMQEIASVGMSLLYAAIVLIAGLKAVGPFIRLIQKGKVMKKLDPTALSFIISLLRILLNALVIITAANILGIPMTSFITILASCGVAIGLALQGSLSNFAGGLMLLIFKPFRVGDFITAGGYTGTVRSISVFYTMVVTADKQVVTIPNGNLTAGAVVNHSTEPYRRADFEFSASYSDDVDKVKEILLGVARGYEWTLGHPEPFAYVSAHGDSAVMYKLCIFVKWEHYWDAQIEINGLVKKAFDGAGIEIPFPQLDVHTDAGESK